MFKYLTADGAVQLIHIQVEIPTVLVDFCTGWGIGDGLTMFGSVMKEIFTKIRLNVELTGLCVCTLKDFSLLSFLFFCSLTIIHFGNNNS